MLLEITKYTIGIVTEIGVGYISSAAINKVVSPENLTKFGKVCVGAATFGIGALAGYNVSAHVQGIIDDVAEMANKIKNSIKIEVKTEKEAKAQKA